MTDLQVLHGLQAIDEVMDKPEYAVLNKCYYFLYQSLIPNCKLTIKILRRHFTITDQVEQYILSGDSRRLCCQRVMNMLLVHLDIVKDHHQFCDWLDSVSVMGSLIDKIKADTTNKLYSQHANVKISDGVDQLDDSVVDNVIISCTVSDEEALVDKACSCSGSRRRPVRQKMPMSTRQLKGISKTTRQSKRISGLVTGMMLESPKEIVKKPRSTKLSLNLKCLLNPSEWSIVNVSFPLLCESLPVDHQSTIEKLKGLPEFAGSEQQQQLDTLIPAKLMDFKLINKRIITFIVVTLSYNTSSGGMTRFSDIMDKLMGSSSCVQEIRCVGPDGASSLPTTPLSDLSNITLHPDMKPSFGQHMTVTMATTVPTCSTTGGVIPSVVNSRNDVTVEVIPGLELVQSHYSNILQCLPTNYGQTLEVLLRCFSDDQVCQILSTDNHITANKTILDFLIGHYKENRNLSELCDRLEKVMNILPEPGELVAILCDLRAVASQHQHQVVEHHQPVNNLAETHDKDDDVVELPHILTSNEDFSVLKSHYDTIVQLMPAEYEQSVGKLQNHISDEQIWIILSCSNCNVANKMMLNCLIEKLKCKEDLLDLCDQLEKISNSSDLMVLITEIKSGVAQSIQHPGVSHVSQNNTPSSLSSNHQLADPQPPAGSHSPIFQLAFSQTSLDPNSKVVTILKKNFVGLCRCLPRDHMVTITRLKRRATVGDGLQHDLNNLPSINERNEMILAIMIKQLNSDFDVLQFCDTIEDVIDSDSVTSKKFIHNLRSEVIEVVSNAPVSHSNGNQSSGSSPDSAAEARCTSFFNQAIAQHMVVLSPNCKGLLVLRRNFAKLCYCLPPDYKKTLSKIKRTAVVPEGLEYQLAMLPTAELANCNILAAMIRPLRKEVHLVGFCDSVENLVDSEESKKIVGDLRYEIIEALSDSAETTTVNTIPVSSTPTAVASMLPDAAQPLSNVSASNMSVTNVSSVAEAMSAQPSSSSEERLRTLNSFDSPPTTAVTTSTFPTSQS